MTCPTCGQGEMSHGTTTVTLERGELTFVAKDVPALICENCVEEYVDEEVTAQVMRMAEEAVASGVQVDVRAFRAA